jgi:hypothetical protein
LQLLEKGEDQRRSGAGNAADGAGSISIASTTLLGGDEAAFSKPVIQWGRAPADIRIFRAPAFARA